MSKEDTHNRRKKTYSYLLITTLCWGASLVIVKPALEFTSPFRFLFYRYLVATTVFSLFYLSKKRDKLAKVPLTRVIALELLATVVSLSILFYGLSQTTAIEASLIGTTGPVFITLAGIFLLKEKQERCEWAGLLLSVIGSILIITSQNGLNNKISLLGNLFVLTYNITNALYYVLAKKYYHQLDKALVGAISFIVGLIGFFIINLILAHGEFTKLMAQIAQDWTHRSVQVASIYMGIFGSVIGFICYIKGQENIEASEASLFAYLNPLIYLPLGILLLGETVSSQQIIGLGVVFLGILLAGQRTH
jgi:drug/metabolite transporter (DMT)-like permease